MNKRLLLVLPKNEQGYWGKIRHGKAGLVRLSLPALAAITPPDWHVKIHDSRAKAVNYDEKVDLVGITGFSAEIPDTYAIADNFRKKGVPVVLGGVHVSALPQEALDHADSVVIGEAEGVWEELLRDLVNGRLKRIYKAENYCDMQNMKTARRDLLDREIYTSFSTVQATRGCPFDCDYCAVTGVFGRKFRTRPVFEVIDEIKSFDTREFFFVDDNICGHPEYAKSLFKALIPLNKHWGGQTSITFAQDDELLNLYSKSGGKYAFVGFESISEENLLRINKKWNQAGGFGEAVKRIHASGINIIGSFIFGLDADDPSVFERTLDFIMEKKIDAVQFHILTPFPGTRLFEAMESQNRITVRDWSRYHTSDVVFKPAKMTGDELQKGYYNIFHKTYSIKNIIRRVFRSYRGIKYRLVINISYRNKAKKMPFIS